MTEDIKTAIDEIKKYLDIKQEETLQRFCQIDGRLDGMDGRLSRIEEKTGAIFEQVSVNSEDLAAIKDDIGGIKSDMQQKISYKEFASAITEK